MQHARRTRGSARAVVAAALLAAAAARADDGNVYYHYTNKSGTEVFVDQLYEVPMEYRGRVKKVVPSDRGPDRAFVLSRQGAGTHSGTVSTVASGGSPPVSELLASLAMVAAANALFVWMAARLTGLRLPPIGAFVACAASVAIAAFIPGAVGVGASLLAFGWLAYWLGAADSVADVLVVVLAATVLATVLSAPIARVAGALAVRLLGAPQ
jgi:hypothetical protein